MAEATRAKPNIETVFAAFQKFQADSLRVTRHSSPGKWQSGLKACQDHLRDELDAMGLAEHIDWQDPA